MVMTMTTYFLATETDYRREQLRAAWGHRRTERRPELTEEPRPERSRPSRATRAATAR